jgi:drug/metabolite transporter (DMT)-like permease
MAAADGGRSSVRSSTIVLVLAIVAAVSAVAVYLLARNIGEPVGETGDWIALFLPVIVIDALITVVGVPRALADLRRAGGQERTLWQPVCALCLFAVAAAAVVFALWLFGHRHPEPLP